MKKILFINACIRPCSRTLEMAKALLNKAEGTIEEIALDKLDLDPLDFVGLEKRNQAVSNRDFTDPSFDLAKQFAAADVIVIAAPYWDLMFPAILKTYLENVAVCGLTFAYTPEGRPRGMCSAKSLYYITSAGGYIGENDFGYSYIKALAQTLFEIQEVVCIAAEGLDIAGANVDEIIEKAKNNLTQRGDKL